MADSITYAGSTAAFDSIDCDVLCVPVFGADDDLRDVEGLDIVTGGDSNRARTSGEFAAKAGDVWETRVTGSAWRARRVMLVGVGPVIQANAERLRRTAAAAGYAARARKANRVAFLVRGTAERAAFAQAAADGLSAADFQNGSYKSTNEEGPAFAEVTVAVPGGDAAVVQDAVRRGRIIGTSANFARGLANEPANVLTPSEFADRVRAEAVAVGLTAELLDETRIAALGMRLLLSVAQGSAAPPRLIVLRHEPAEAPPSPVLAFIGKGITFDTGGISIKPADGMERMKDDMAGGAAVAAAMRALALLEAPYRVIGLIPAAENMPGSRASRPGDVVRGASGKTVEIINTDAEGRLILADALWYARELGATHLVDVATLTGAVVVALGRHVSGLFGQPAAWVDAVRAAADSAGDRVWPMPIYDEAREQLRSEIADLINSAGRPGGSVTAAAFLREFAGTGDWAHLDIAGTAWAETKTADQPKGATGVAVRTLIDLGLTAGRSSGRRTD